MPTSANTKPSTSQSESAPERHKIVVTKVGMVESDKRNKTRTVVVRFKTMHPKYGKFMARKTVLQVHDENNESHVGDTVEVKPCRPISKTKKWTLVRIVEKSQRVEHVSTPA